MSIRPESPPTDGVRLTLPIDRDEEHQDGDELCSVINGRKVDAHLHDEILSGVDAVRADQLARENGRELGLTEEQMEILFGPVLTEQRRSAKG
jgi:hypothetical protein